MTIDPALIALQMELERLRSIPPMRSPMFYVVTIFGLCLLGISSILAIVVLRPEGDNTTIIIAIVGFLAPTVAAIVALMVKDVHVLINSRMTELLVATAQASRAEGKVEGKAEEKADRA